LLLLSFSFQVPKWTLAAKAVDTARDSAAANKVMRIIFMGRITDPRFEDVNAILGAKICRPDNG